MKDKIYLKWLMLGLAITLFIGGSIFYVKNIIATTYIPNGSSDNITKVQPNSQTSLTITWQASYPSGNVENINRCIGSGCSNFTQVATTTAGDLTQSWVDNAAYCGTTFTYKVCSTYGCTLPAGASTDACTPGAPTSVTASPTSQTTAQVCWTRNSPYDESGFTIYEASPNAGVKVGSAAAGATCGTASGLTANTTYSFFVVAYVNTNGRTYSAASGSSNYITTDAVPPGPPTIGTASPTGQTTVNVTWTRNSPYDESGFQIMDYVSGLIDGGASAGSTSGSANVSNVGSCYVTDSFAVRSFVNTNGRTYYSNWSAWSNSVTTDQCPAGPPTLNSVNCNYNASTGYMSTNLSWSDGSPQTQTRFEATRNGTTVVTNIPPSALSWTDPANLIENTTYNYQMRADTDTNGRTYYSLYSNTLGVTCPGVAPSTPGTPSVPTYSKTGIFTISWAASTDYGGSGFKQYNIQMSSNGSATYSSYAVQTTNSYTIPSTAPLSQGVYAFRVNAQDNAGNQSAYSAASPNVIVDTTAPTCGTWSPSSPSWTNTSQTFTLSGSTDSGGSGINVSGGSCSVTTNGGTCNVTISDNAGNTTTCTSPAAKIDNIAPTVTAFAPLGAVTNSYPVLNYTVTDTGGSNLSNVQLWRTTDSGGSPNQSGWTQVASASISGSSYSGSFTDTTASGNTTYWYGIHVVDAAGNCINESGGHCGGVSSDSLDTRAAVGPDKVIYDTTAPATPSISANPSGWTNGNVTISVSASDSGGSGLNTTYYRCNTSNSWSTTQSTSFTFTCSSTGGQTAQAYSTDNAGNTGATGGVNYYIDTTAPTAPSLNPTSKITNNINITVSFSATDSGGSGLGGYRYCYTTNGSTCSPSTVGSSVTFSSVNSYTVCANAYDNAGNTGGTTCSAANAYQYTSVSAPTSITASAAPVAGLTSINAGWSGTANGFNVYIQRIGSSTSTLMSSSNSTSGTTIMNSLQCPSDYYVYIVAYNTDLSLNGTTSTSCIGSWGQIPNAQCTVITKTVQLRTCTQGFFGQ